MHKLRLLALAAVIGVALSPAIVQASPEGSDTVSPAEATLILDYWRKQCDQPKYFDSCIPGGVDLQKNEVHVTDRDILTRNNDVDELEKQTVADIDLSSGHNNYAQFLNKCKPPVPPKYNVDMAIYKLRDKHAWEVASSATENMWRACDGYSKSPETQAAIHLFQKVKLIHVAFAPPSPALEQDVDYDFDASTGTLTIRAFAKNPLPNSSTVNANWNKLLKNN